MEKNSGDFSGFSMQEAMKLANSDTGRQLYDLLQRTQGDTLQSAMDQAAAGNMEQVKAALQQMMRSPEARQLMQKMGSGGHG